MQIQIEKIPDHELKPLYTDPEKLGFGTIFTDYMFAMHFQPDQGWVEPKISRFAPISLHPATNALHYCQEIFEGLKVYAATDGRILLFRPEQNAKRMYSSALRICMKPFPEEYFLEAITTLVNLEKRWIPRTPGTSIYIRPTLVGLGAGLGVHPAPSYLFFIILSPVAAYYKEGFKPIRLYVEEYYIRAALGGLGDTKTGANYAASLMAATKAEAKGFTQVLWLDAREKKYIEEVGSMNIFFVFDRKLVTPILGGSILPGITRASVLELAKSLKYQVEERPISIDEVIGNIENGSLTEIFGTGTAAVISPVGLIQFKGKDYLVNNNQIGKITEELYTKLVDIQYGNSKDPFGWVREIGRL